MSSRQRYNAKIQIGVNICKLTNVLETSSSITKNFVVDLLPSLKSTILQTPSTDERLSRMSSLQRVRSVFICALVDNNAFFVLFSYCGLYALTGLEALAELHP